MSATVMTESVTPVNLQALNDGDFSSIRKRPELCGSAIAVRPHLAIENLNSIPR